MLIFDNPDVAIYEMNPKNLMMADFKFADADVGTTSSR